MNNKMPNFMMLFVDYFLDCDVSIENIIYNYEDVKRFKDYDVYYSSLNNTAFFTCSDEVEMIWSDGELIGWYYHFEKDFIFNNIKYAEGSSVGLLIQDNLFSERVKVKDLYENCIISTAISNYFNGLKQGGKFYVKDIARNELCFEILSLLIFDEYSMFVYQSDTGEGYLSNGSVYLSLDDLNHPDFKCSEAQKYFKTDIDYKWLNPLKCKEEDDSE